MKRNLAVIGVGNMAKAIINGIISSDLGVGNIYLYDKNVEAFNVFSSMDGFVLSPDIGAAVSNSDCILLSVKPQNYQEILNVIKKVPGHEKKLFISIGAGITTESVSEALSGAIVIRVLPNLPITIGLGVSVVCKNEKASSEDFLFVRSVFDAAGSTFVIDESEMNRMIGVTSSSPAYVFKFIDSICKGAEAQGLDGTSLLQTVCDMVIGSARLLRDSGESPESLISKVASKGGTTERALAKLEDGDIENVISAAMKACTSRADELGNN